MEQLEPKRRHPTAEEYAFAAGEDLRINHPYLNLLLGYTLNLLIYGVGAFLFVYLGHVLILIVVMIITGLMGY